jgi:spermidine synthase
MILGRNPLDKTDESEWVFETISSSLVTGHQIKKKIYNGESQYQKVDVVELGDYHKCLMIDGHVQSSEKDEFIYHECLVQPAMLLHPNPKRVFIAGGGEGATLREILRHKTVEKVTMVDIDDIVVRVSKEYFPHHHDGSFENPKTDLVCADVKAYLENTQEKFDVIIMDLPDPIEEGPAFLLYTQKFYRMLKEKLNVDGIIVTQSGPGGPTIFSEFFSPIYKTLSTVFDVVAPYATFVPSFADCNAFNIASNGLNPTSLTEAEVDTRIAERIIGGAASLQLYDGITHRHLFSLPKFIRKQLQLETNIITEDSPAFCFRN